MGSSKIKDIQQKGKRAWDTAYKNSESFFSFLFFFDQEEKIAKYTEKERKIKEVGFRQGSV